MGDLMTEANTGARLEISQSQHSIVHIARQSGIGSVVGRIDLCWIADVDGLCAADFLVLIEVVVVLRFR